MQELLHECGASLDRLGLYEFSPISLPWFSDEYKANIEIEIIGDKKSNVISVLLVPDTEGIVERTLVLTAIIDSTNTLKKMFVAKLLRENLISDIGEFKYSKQHNAYSIKDPNVFLLVLRRLLEHLPKKDITYLGAD